MNAVAPSAAMLLPGDPAPWFRAPLLGGDPSFPFDKMAGRHIALLLFGSAAHPPAAEALKLVAGRAGLFDDLRATFFGVSIDPGDLGAGMLPPGVPHLHVLIDRDGTVSRLYGALDGETQPGKGAAYRPHWLLLDPGLNVIGRYALAEGQAALAALDEALAAPPADMAAPVLQIANVLEPALCRDLMAFYERVGGVDSGVMRQVGGKTVAVMDHGHKRRRDCEIGDPALRDAIRDRVVRRIVPMLRRAFHFEASRIERYIVACYDAATGGYFNPHRDNTTLGTAHRRFAVTINLNGDYEGGDLRFPEYGARTYRAPPGGAIIFSCSMQHQATPVTAGRRFATLPFLYDEAAAAVRKANLHALEDERLRLTANAG